MDMARQAARGRVRVRQFAILQFTAGMVRSGDATMLHSRQERYGPGCTVRPGAIWQAWRGPPSLALMARQARSGEDRLLTCGFTRRAALVPQRSRVSQWHGRQLMARRCQVAHGQAGNARRFSELIGESRQEWHSTAAPAIAGYAAHRWAFCGSAVLAWFPMLRSGRQCEESRCMYRCGRHGTDVRVGIAHHGRQGVVRRTRSGLASQVKAGMALLVQSRQARTRWPHKGSKSRQARYGRLALAERVVASPDRRSAIANRQHNGPYGALSPLRQS